MSRNALVCLLCLSSAGVEASRWRDLEPGVSGGDAVVAQFGEPSQRVKIGDREILLYTHSRAIAGTTRVEIRLEADTQKIDRIEVFPAAAIPRATVVGTYGPMCP